jgi:glucokinase
LGKQILGLDLAGLDLGRGSRAVVVDEEGAVLRREQPFSEATAREFDLGAVGVSVEWGGSEGVGVDLPPALQGSGPPLICEPGIAAAMAETWVGAARGARHAICLLIGEGVTAGIVLDGKPWLGARGRAGAAAWLALNPVERQDYRKVGSLAAEVSSKGIARRLSWRIQAGDHSAVLERAGDLESITAAHVFEGARTGDGVSISVVRDTAKYIGMAVANLAVAIDPEVIVIGGAVAAAGDLMIDPIRQEAMRRLPPDMAEAIRIEMSPLGEDVVAIGAARLAMRERA